MRASSLLIALILCSFPLVAQRGDRPGEVQNPPPAEWKIPEAPVLSAGDALGTFKLAEGYRIELVAAEPLVEDPVAMAFDHRGRLWVVEMLGYMPDVDGVNEDAAIGRISVLTDEDGDGMMDAATAFAEDLVLPRGLAFNGDAILVIEPPYLRWYRDTDGDDVADEDGIVATEMGGLVNPEHAGNGLLYGIDNRFHMAKHPVSFRFQNDAWNVLEQPPVGQWGIAQDDAGRLYFNTNSAGLRGAAYAPHYASRNRALGRLGGADFNVVKDQRVWPSRINPGVNRGYRKGTLRKDGRLARYTAACGPLIYRGDAMPEFRGNAFICEPAGNLITRNTIDATSLRMKGERANPGTEFLTSTDERFRPVALADGPDGALYVADFYRGIIQHKTYVTTFLRKQIIARELEQPLGLGRIWRIVPVNAAKSPSPAFDPNDGPALVRLLDNPNGWVRDTAQRLIVQHQRTDAMAPLRRLVTDAKAPAVARLHAWWALEGLGAVTAELVTRALADDHVDVQIAGLRLVETLPGDRAALVDLVAPLANSRNPRVRLQVLLSLGELRSPNAIDAMIHVLRRDAASRDHQDAALSSAEGLEMRLARGLLSETKGRLGEQKHRNRIFRALGKCVGASSHAPSVQDLLTFVGDAQSSHSDDAAGLLRGLVDSRPKPPKKRRPFRMRSEPKGWAGLLKSDVGTIRKTAQNLDGIVTWPGRPGWDALALRPLNDEELARFDRGRKQYEFSCAGCHQRSGGGAGGLAPPLRGSEWVEGPVSRLGRIAIHGLEGPIQVKGRTYQLEMPPQGSLTDEDLAAIFTYVRRAWGNEGDPVTPAMVGKIRGDTKERGRPYTAEELLKLPE